jgi:hypothetical protein
MFRVLLALVIAAALGKTAQARPNIEHVFVIVMENKDAVPGAKGDVNYIYGNTEAAPYINTELMPSGAHASNFVDELPDLPSEPHYILMEAGTATFDDADFTCNAEPLSKCEGSEAQNWTASPNHLVTQISNAGLSWMTYAEGIDPPHTGACPITSHGAYAARHVPFGFFADVAGAPPSWTTPGCAEHFREFGALKDDLAAGNVANYVFIVPNVCHAMHGMAGCRDRLINAGDDFLKSFVPGLVAWSKQNRGIVMLVWDEDEYTGKIPFVLAGAGVKENYASARPYSHRSIVRTVESIFGLPPLDTVKDAPDFGDMFTDGAFP